MAPAEPVSTSADAPTPGTAAPEPPLHRSPLYDAHVALDAKLVAFGGWLMPLAYGTGTIAEHTACRRDAVAFDVSHLGTVRVEGPDAFARLQRELSNDLRKVGPGRAQYTHLLDEADGSVVDDIIVWWLSDEAFDVMPNASNTARVRAAIGGEDTTASRAVIAVQGPLARSRLAHVAPDAAAVPRFGVTPFAWEDTPCVAAGTGYTGEDGVECSVPAAVAARFWQRVLDTGVVPAGLGARDTLRLEAGFPLHGHELGPGITPLQAGLGWVVGWDKAEFRGRSALELERQAGPRRMLHGLVTEGRQPPREGATVLVRSSAVGAVTSGNFSPVLSRGIALAFVDTAAAVTAGDEVALDVRGRLIPARVTHLPFVPAGRRAEAAP